MPIASTWNCSDVALDLSRPRVMGVLNVTPDSFSDGGAHDAPKAAIATAAQMLADGADLIDVGGESTRPGFTPVEPDGEYRRLEPVVRWLAKGGRSSRSTRATPRSRNDALSLGRRSSTT